MYVAVFSGRKIFNKLINKLMTNKTKKYFKDPVCMNMYIYVCMYDYILPSHLVGYVSFGIEFKNATVLVIGSSRNVTPSGSVGTFLSTHSLKYVIHTQSESNDRIRERYSFINYNFPILRT